MRSARKSGSPLLTSGKRRAVDVDREDPLAVEVGAGAQCAVALITRKTKPLRLALEIDRLTAAHDVRNRCQVRAPHRTAALAHAGEQVGERLGRRAPSVGGGAATARPAARSKANRLAKGMPMHFELIDEYLLTGAPAKERRCQSFTCKPERACRGGTVL